MNDAEPVPTVTTSTNPLMDAWVRSREERRDTLHTRIERRKPLLVQLCREWGITSIQCNFYGSGDSGSIEHIQFYPDDELGNRLTPFPNTPSLRNAVEDLINDMLEDADVDWYNDDGGQGAWMLNIDPNNANLEFYIDQNYTETNRAHTYEGPFVDTA